jgi:hypothetical protein
MSTPTRLIPPRSFHYRVIRSDRVPGPKYADTLSVVATGLSWKEAKRLDNKLTADHAGQSSWTGPIFYCEQEPQTEWEFACRR